MNNTSRDASGSGYITTLLGRKCRFDKWEEAVYNPGVLKIPMSHAEAEKKYGGEYIRRAFTYKALNKLIQGSAADMTKKAMLDLYREGIIPHIQVHDELDISVEKGSNQHEKIIKIMKTAVKLKIPNKVDYESGDNWGEIKG
jgi:DNA polymerase I-like protein with 3'-5' exonuclease and polymerase domains